MPANYAGIIRELKDELKDDLKFSRLKAWPEKEIEHTIPADPGVRGARCEVLRPGAL